MINICNGNATKASLKPEDIESNSIILNYPYIALKLFLESLKRGSKLEVHGHIAKFIKLTCHSK